MIGFIARFVTHCLMVGSIASFTLTGCVPKSQVREEVPEKYFPLNSAELSLPEKADVYSRMQVAGYADPRLGVSVNYASSEPGVKIDVFVYPVVVPELYSLADMNELAFRQSVSDVQSVTPGAEIQEVVEFSGDFEGKRYEALKARLKLDGSIKADSFVYVGMVKDAYVKIRFTSAQALTEKVDPDRFARQILTGISFNQPDKHTHPLHVIITRGTYDLTKGVQSALGFTILLGVQLREQIARGHFLDSFQREYAVWDNAYATWKKVPEKAEAQPSAITFVDALRDVQDAGYMREYIWNYFRRPYWTQPDGLRMTDFKVWAETHLSGHIAPVNHGIVIAWEDKT